MIDLDGPRSIISQLKIIKNSTEINGLKAALQTESCALVSFYSEVKERITNGGFAEHEGELMLHN